MCFCIFIPIFDHFIYFYCWNCRPQYVFVHFILSLPRLLFISNFCACDLCEFVISHSFHVTSPSQPTPHQFLLKTFLHSNLHCQFVQSSLIRSLHSHDSFFQSSCFCKLRSQVITSKQPKLGLTQELSFSRITEYTTGYTFTPCVGSFTSPGIDTRQKGPATFTVSSIRHRQMWG